MSHLPECAPEEGKSDHFEDRSELASTQSCTASLNERGIEEAFRAS